MDIAKCTLDEKLYTALEFSQLPPNELSNKRKQLICPECQTTAFFRKASRNGQAAHFGSRHHIEGCPFSSPETKSLDEKEFDEDTILNPEHFIKVILNNEATASNTATKQVTTDNEKQAQDVKSLEQKTKSISYTRLKLSMLLAGLVSSEKFRSSNKKIEFESNRPTTVSSFFVNFNDVKCISDVDLHGYWGMLTDARLSSDGSLWLNSGGTGGVSCVIPAEIVDEFFKRYKLEDEEDLAGAYALVIGTKKTSQNKKDHIKLTNINYIYIRKILTDKNLKGHFFLSEKKRIAFLIKNNEKGIFDDELGIKRKHYLDKDAAKEWKAKLAREFHPDKNLGDPSLDYDEIFSHINKIYNRMVGKA